MCKKGTGGCRKPEKLTGRPQGCTPEQIKECHGEAKEHPCVQKARQT